METLCVDSKVEPPNDLQQSVYLAEASSGDGKKMKQVWRRAASATFGDIRGDGYRRAADLAGQSVRFRLRHRLCSVVNLHRKSNRLFPNV